MKNNGFVDLQVNGWMGTNFTAPGLTLEDVRRVTRAMIERGTIAYCPTVITGDPDVYRENFAVLAKAMDDPVIGPHLLGIHLEGPFISPLPGARGAHDEKYVRPPSCEDLDLFQKWAGGKIRLLTVAPEIAGMPALIRHAVAAGMTVSLGHHLADENALQSAVNAGARSGTHIGNGIPNQIERHNNPLWWQLACDELWGMFITDGHHLPPAVIKVMLRAKSPGKFIVVSDASPLAGLPAGRHQVFGLDVTISAAGRIFSTATQGLVGAHASMIGCMNHLAGLGLLDEAALWTVGHDNPLRLLELASDHTDALPGPGIEYVAGRFTVATGR